MPSTIKKTELEMIVSENFRKVVTNIEFANVDNKIKTIMVTSSAQGEGKTTTISNLALIMSDLNKKILLIDMDLRRPAVHRKFGISNHIGLTDLLLNKDDYTNYVNKMPDNLDIITAGKMPSNPAEIVVSKTVKNLLKSLSQEYDYIFIDTPPVAMVSDPINISTYVDGVIIVVAYGEVEKNTVKKSVSSLKQVNANIIGTIFNKVPSSNKKNYKYYY